jgi:hypothetical protein
VKKKSVAEARYGVVRQGLAVVGFRTPFEEEGKGENVVREREVRVASKCLAVIGMPSTMQFGWDGRASSEFIAAAIGGKVVELP